MLHSKRLQASWGQAPSPPARTLCARSLRSLAACHAAGATRSRSPAALCWLAGKGFRSRRRVPAPRLRFVWLSLLICSVAPLRLVGVALSRGPPPRLRPCRPRPHFCVRALLRLAAAALAALGRFAGFARAGSTTFRPKVCDAPAGAFRPCGALAVQSP